MTQSFCPECNFRIEIAGPELGQLLTCNRCKTELEVIYVNPLQLDWVYDYAPNEYIVDEEPEQLELD